MTTQHQGQIAEHLVAAHLCEQGFNVSFSPSGSRYDLIAERDGKFFRVQVKSTAKPTRGNYVFWMKKNREYKKGEFDLAACVALDLKMIGFLPAKNIVGKKSLSLRPPKALKPRGRLNDYTIADCSLAKALKQIKK